jgi:hypothetical protein
MDIYKSKIEIPCPECKTKNGVTLGMIAEGHTINCVGCKKKIKLVDKDGSVKKSAKSIDSGIKDLQKSVKNLNDQLKF